MTKIEWIKALKARRPKMGYIVAGNWMRLAWSLREVGRDITVDEAAAWDALGYWPEPDEAGQKILDGVTAAEQAVLDAAEVAAAGGQEQHAAQVIAAMYESGILVPESKVIRIPDPLTPGVEIIARKDDL